MDTSLILTGIVFNLVAYGLALAAATVLVESLSQPWRRAVVAHWTERARLAFAPGFAVLWLAILLPPLAALVATAGLGVLRPGRDDGGFLGFGFPGLAALAGVLTVRYRWLRQLWGPRVTLRSWLAGCLVLLLLVAPHLLITMLLIFLLPDAWNGRAVLMLGGALLAVAFFAWGGGALPLRSLGILQPAPPAITRMVEQLAQAMKVPGRLKVFQLEWAQVNAVAWELYRAVGFSRPLLEVMSPDEVRAVAAHELGHLLEPPWVRTVRLVQMFCYLAVPPVVRYGGALGLPAGWLLLLGIAFGYRRFTRRLEVRADRLESQAIGDADAYMRSMIKLHEANLAPAVMPGAQTHPHLYDRLLAGGIQPDFPRPLAPARSKPLLAMLAAAFITTLVMFFLLIIAGVLQRLFGTHAT